MVNTVFQITYNILTPVIYLAVYMAVRDNPASPKLQQLSGRDIHKHTRFLVINPVIHTTDDSSACFTYFLFNGFQSLIHFHECLSFDTYKFHKLCFFCPARKYGKEKSWAKGCHQTASDVIRCQRPVCLGKQIKRMAKSLFLYRKKQYFYPGQSVRKNRKYGTDNQCNIITSGYRSLDIRTILEEKVRQGSMPICSSLQRVGRQGENVTSSHYSRKSSCTAVICADLS